MAIGAYKNNGNGADSGHVRVYRTTALSIQQNTFGTALTVYPNPSFGLSKINLGTTYTAVSVRIVDILGKEISVTMHNNVDSIELDTSNYTSGMYFVKVVSGTKEATIKLVKN